MTTVKQILKHIGSPSLDLVKGDGYWYFVYDDGAKRYDTRSVWTPRLNDMGIDKWINDGRDFVTDMEVVGNDHN